MRIKKLKINAFRHVEDQEIIFWDKLTVITGQNSTWKSSILWWIAQACDYKWKAKTLTWLPFKSKYSDIFRFCEENDYLKTYQVSLVYKESEDGENEEKIMRTRHLGKTEKWPERYRVDFDKRGRALDYPVIYLWLKRLIPLATEKNVLLEDITLNSSEATLFSNLSKEILILLDDTIKSELVNSTNKDILAMKTEQYWHLWNSAWQDNIWQIISSLLSFWRLIKETDTTWGILLIDEIDATLYVGSQIKLIECLYRFSKTHNIQVIFTTHSIEILEYLSEKVWFDTSINFLELVNWKIQNKLNPDIKELKDKIKVQVWKKDEIIKKQIICEDKETVVWCKNLLNGTDYKNELEIVEWPFSEGTLSKMADSKSSIFKQMFFVLDGDCRDKYKTQKMPPRTIMLPWDHRPESIFYNFLRNLPDDDNFWKNDLTFSKQICFKDYQTSSYNKWVIKRWFKDPNFSEFFGRGYSKLLNRWKKENQEVVAEFQLEFEKMISS